MKKYFFIAIVFIAASCEEVVRIELPASQNLVVVEGWVTNTLENQYVRLSISNPFLDEQNLVPIENAGVVVQSRTGNTFQYAYEGIGIYRSITPFAGLEGTEYRVRILLDNGEEIRSSWERMAEAVPILSLNADNFLENDPDNPSQQVTIYYPKILAVDPADTRNFYRWVFYKNRFIFSEPEPITLQDDRFFDGNLIPNSFQSFEYDLGDEIIVQFQSINQEAYNYLELLRSQITTLGTSGGTTPAIVNGNVDYVSDNLTEMVLGYFGTIAISSDTTVVQ